ncbi:MAG: hypothetical protein Fur002_24880 [Anaerolineales bacterium]
MNIESLRRTLNVWIFRWRIQRAALYAARGLAVGLGFALLAGGAGLYFQKIIKTEFAWFVLISSLAAALLFGLIAALWKISPMQAARHFDREFHLRERVSSALEVTQSQAENPLAQNLLQDAIRSASKIQPARQIPLRVKKLDAALILIFSVFIAVLWLRGESLFAAAQRQRNLEISIEQQRAKVAEIIRAIEENKALTDEQKQALTEPLKQAQESLRQTNTLEDAVSTLTTTGEKMQALSEKDAQSMQALKEAGGSLAGQEGSPLQALGQDLASGNFAKAAADLANLDLSQMTPQELAQLANQLDALAESLASSNPQMAQALQDAAKQIRAGNLSAAQQSLQSAAQKMAATAQQAAGTQAAQQAGGQLSAGAQNLLAAGGGQQGQPLNAQQGNSGQGNSGGAGGGSGRGDSPDASQIGGEAALAPIEQNNGAGDGGESTYEQIYSPALTSGDAPDAMGLPTSGEDGEAIGERPAAATDGESLVPYTEVYSQYDAFNHQAIENGDAPPQFLELIKNYFSSIQP